MTIRVFKNTLMIGATALVISCAGLLGASAASAKSNTPAPVASLSKLDQLLTKSIKQTNLPTDLVPSLNQLASGADIQGSAYLRKSCDPYVFNSQAHDPVPCWYGSTKATRTVVIFGDSFVGNWIPALNIAGKDLGFRVAEFSFVGCNTPFVSPAGPEPGFDESEVKACTVFHDNLPGSVNALNPVAVLAVSGAPSWGSAGNPSFIQNLGKAFDEMSTAKNHPIRILLGTGPHLTESAPSCLASHPGNINVCSLKYGAGSDFSATLQRDNAAIAGAQVHLIPTYEWLCQNNVCPAVIGRVVVYADEDHMTIAISKFLSIMLERALTPLLGAAQS